MRIRYRNFSAECTQRCKQLRMVVLMHREGKLNKYFVCNYMYILHCLFAFCELKVRRFKKTEEGRPFTVCFVEKTLPDVVVVFFRTGTVCWGGGLYVSMQEISRCSFSLHFF